MAARAEAAAKAAGGAFAGAAWLLLRSPDHRVSADALRGGLAALAPAQAAAAALAAVALAALLAFAGLAVLLRQHELQQEDLQRRAGTLDPARGAARRPSTLAKIVCITISAAAAALCAANGIRRFLAQRDQADWPPHFGLLCGLGAVAVAQVCLMVAHFALRSGLFGDLSQRHVQLRGPQYERTFWGDMVHHFSNPGAFILMLPYLCLTWMFRLMPESYYDYDSPVSWGNVLLQLLFVDLLTYTNHIVEHCFSSLYKVSHKPHHRFVSPHFFNAFDGSLADTVGLILLPLFATAQVLHVSNWDYIAFGTVYSTHFMLIHSEFVLPWDSLLEFFYVNTTEDHHVHHAMFTCNFGHFFTIYDHLGGTYRHGSTCPGFRSCHARKLGAPKQL